MRRLVLGLAAALAACGGSSSHSTDAPTGTSDGSATTDAPPIPTGPPDGEANGTRLKDVWYQTADGAQQVATDPQSRARIFHDSLRNEDCEPMPWAAGGTYCTPAATTVLYTDSSCSQPILEMFADACRPLPSYALERSRVCDGAADQVAHLYARGAQVAMPATVYTQLGTTCSGRSGSASYQYYALGAEVLATDVVQLTAQTTGTGRLAPTTWHSSDGLVATSGAHDTMLDVDCALTDRDATTCMPISPIAYSTQTYADNTCSQPIIEGSTGCAAPGPYVQHVDYANGCLAQATVTSYATGSAATPSVVYEPFNNACSTTLATGPYYSIGAPAQLATTQRAADSSPARRLEPIHYAVSGASLRDPTFMYDTLLATECALTVLDDGSVECLPRQDNTSIFTSYTDGTCTTQLALAQVLAGPAGCTPPHPPQYMWESFRDNKTCKDLFSAYKLSSTLHAGTVWTGTSSSCRMQSASSDAYYDGTTFDPSMFATATRVVGP